MAILAFLRPRMSKMDSIGVDYIGELLDAIDAGAHHRQEPTT